MEQTVYQSASTVRVGGIWNAINAFRGGGGGLCHGLKSYWNIPSTNEPVRSF